MTTTIEDEGMSEEEFLAWLAALDSSEDIDERG